MRKLLWLLAFIVVAALFMLMLPVPVIQGGAGGTETPTVQVKLTLDRSVTGIVRLDHPILYTFALPHDRDIVVEIKSTGPLSVTDCYSFQFIPGPNGDGGGSGSNCGTHTTDGKTPLIVFLPLESTKDYDSAYALTLSMVGATDSSTARSTTRSVSYTLTTYQIAPKALNSNGSASDTFLTANPYQVYQTTSPASDWILVRVQLDLPAGPYLWTASQEPGGDDSAFRVRKGFGPWALVLTRDRENKTYHVLVGGAGKLSLTVRDVSIQELPTRDFKLALNKDSPVAIYRWPTSGDKQSLEASFNVSSPESYVSISVLTPNQGGGSFTVGGLQGEGFFQHTIHFDLPVDHDEFLIMQLGPNTESAFVQVNYAEAKAATKESP